MYNTYVNDALDALMAHDGSQLLWLVVVLVLGLLLGSKAVYARKQASIAAEEAGVSDKTSNREEREAGGKCFMAIGTECS
jgi:hypothetical protein